MEHLSKNVKKFFNYIDEEHKEQINNFYISNIDREYKDININDYDGDKTLYDFNEITLLREYSGYNFRHINNILRGRWNYEENGSPDRKQNFLDTARKISEIIENKPTNPGNIKTYRGVNLSYFNEYGIYSIEELINLKGNFILDFGFVSTSISKDKCFFKKENDLGMNYNVKITYLIPEELNDGILLQGNMSYSPGQEEFLINSCNVAKVLNVEINNDNTACITAMIIPKMIYDEYYASKYTNKTR